MKRNRISHLEMLVCLRRPVSAAAAARKEREEKKKKKKKRRKKRREEKRREREKGRCLQIAIESGRLEISNGALKAEKEKQSGKTTEHRNTMVSDPFREREGGLAWLGLIKHGETCAL